MSTPGLALIAAAALALVVLTCKLGAETISFKKFNLIVLGIDMFIIAVVMLLQSWTLNDGALVVSALAYFVSMGVWKARDMELGDIERPFVHLSSCSTVSVVLAGICSLIATLSWFHMAIAISGIGCAGYELYLWLVTPTFGDVADKRQRLASLRHEQQAVFSKMKGSLHVLEQAKMNNEYFRTLRVSYCFFLGMPAAWIFCLSPFSVTDILWLVVGVYAGDQALYWIVPRQAAWTAVFCVFFISWCLSFTTFVNFLWMMAIIFVGHVVMSLSIVLFSVALDVGVSYAKTLFYGIPFLKLEVRQSN